MSESVELELRKTFVEEAEEILDRLSPLHEELLMGHISDEHLDSFFRSLHTLKGSSLSVGYKRIGAFIHAAEEFLTSLRAHHENVNSEANNLLVRILMELQGIVVHLKRDLEHEPPLDSVIEFIARHGQTDNHTAPEPDRAIPRLGQILVAMGATTMHEIFEAKAKQDELKRDGKERRLGEILVESSAITRTQLEAAIAIQTRIMKVHISRQAELAAVSSHLAVKVEIGVMHELIKTLENAGNNPEALGRAAEHVSTVLRDLCQAPVSSVFARFPRTVRDLGARLNKKVNVVVQGGNTRLHRTVVDRLAEPLLHLIQNSLDHGIESPEERVRLHKNPEGTLTLSAGISEGKAFVEMRDDGRGIQRDAVIARALQRGLIAPQDAPTLSDSEIIGLLFRPGFSTATQVSDVSGRGVGLDVVKANVEELGGEIEVESQEGTGTTFRFVFDAV